MIVDLFVDIFHPVGLTFSQVGAYLILSEHPGSRYAFTNWNFPPLPVRF